MRTVHPSGAPPRERGLRWADLTERDVRKWRQVLPELRRHRLRSALTNGRSEYDRQAESWAPPEVDNGLKSSLSIQEIQYNSV